MFSGEDRGRMDKNSVEVHVSERNTRKTINMQYGD